MDSRKRTATFGQAAPIVYLATAILGGVLWPGYSHIRDAVSLLGSQDAPHAGLMNTLFALYNVLLFFFGASWWFEQDGTSRKGKRAANLLALIGILGFTMSFFPQDPTGMHVTPSGGMHILLSAAVAIITVLAMLLRALAEWREPGYRSVSVYSFASLTVVVVAGGFTVAAAAGYGSHEGLLERCAMAAFLAWVFVEAWLLRRTSGARKTGF